MLLGRAMGVTLSEGDVKSLLNGKKILVKNLHAKSGKTFDAYLEPDGIEDFSYTDRNGNERSGSQYRFNMSFPNKKKN
jgi:DNA topoisomerase-3